jgi:uncharacterized protein
MSVKKNDPLRLDVSYLVNQSPGTQKVFEFNFPQLELSPDFTLVDIHGSITISVTEDGVVAEGKLGALSQLSCSRCLDDYWQPVEINFAEIFLSRSSGDLAEGQGEQSLEDDGSIDLSSILRDYALLDIPIRQVCKKDCKGLCPMCGVNLNQEDCGHKIEHIDHRLEGLKQLLEEEETPD